jgi:hypothetical protein
MLIPFADNYSVSRLLRAVERAESVHDSQPWWFQIVAGDRIELHANEDRWLKVADPGARGLFISCGAALFNLRMAIRVTGHNVAVWLLPDPVVDPYLLASVEIVTARTSGPTVPHQELYDAITRRRTNRWPFTGPKVPANILATMKVEAAKEQGWLRLLDRPRTKQWLRAVDNARRELAADERYQDELRQFTPGYPPPSTQFERRPQLMALSTDYDRPLYWLRAGQALQRALLTGTRFGVVASFLGQPLELFDMRYPPGPDQTVRREWPWKWPFAEVPQMVIRVGYTTPGRDDVFRPQLPNVIDRRGPETQAPAA